MTRMRLLPLVGLAILTSTKLWPQSLYNNATPAGLTMEGLRTGPRQGGGDYSEVQAGNITFACSFRQWTYRLADDFYVDSPWKVTAITVWGFQPDIHSPSVNTGLLEIRLGSFQGPVVATGAWVNSKMTDIYRISNGRPKDDRQLQKLMYSAPCTLPVGHYWIVFNGLGIDNVDGPQSPFLTKLGSQTTPGANGKVGVASWTLQWYDLYDDATLLPQDVPFWIDGYRLASFPGTKG